ncbi:MAG: glycerol acyltransferase [Candidatus Hydrogenedentes bacterium]|jgi:1-acyl-sn-glycerol-3-phosphate acyltransferase|nr:glycerol acyltransferase [Candidatus Hydrogenedentota bacterium]
MAFELDKTSFINWTTAVLCRKILQWLGWTVVGNKIDDPKAVLTAAPHTSNWDLFYTLLCARAIQIPMWFMMKNTHFWWPARIFWNWCGGVPIDRSKASGVVGQMVDAFAERERLYMVIPPEGTRKQVDAWKTGFYHIAHNAQVPVWPWFIDYKNRRVGCGDPIYTTGDIEADFARIRASYEENYGPLPHCRPRQH